MTKKAFKELLNRLYPISRDAFVGGNSATGRKLGNTKRDYGDYLYTQDKGMFDALYSEYLDNPDKFVKDSRWTA